MTPGVAHSTAGTTSSTLSGKFGNLFAREATKDSNVFGASFISHTRPFQDFGANKRPPNLGPLGTRGDFVAPTVRGQTKSAAPWATTIGWASVHVRGHRGHRSWRCPKVV